MSDVLIPSGVTLKKYKIISEQNGFQRIVADNMIYRNAELFLNYLNSLLEKSGVKNISYFIGDHDDN